MKGEYKLSSLLTLANWEVTDISTEHEQNTDSEDSENPNTVMEVLGYKDNTRTSIASCINTFKMLYLLGLNRSAIVHLDFVEEAPRLYYQILHELEVIRDAITFRALNRLRYSLILGYPSNRDTSDLNKATGGFNQADIDYLKKDVGIELEELFMESGGYIKVINKCTTHINEYITEKKLFETLGIQDGQYLKVLFQFQDFSDKTFKDFIRRYDKKMKFTYSGIIVPKAIKFDSSVRGKMFMSDFKMYHTAYRLSAKMNLSDISWSSSVSRVTDIIAENKIRYSKLINDTSNRQEEEENKKEEFNSDSFFNTDSMSAIIVDCDNISLFTFIKYLKHVNRVQIDKSKIELYLCADSRSKHVWRMMDKLNYTDISTNVTIVPAVRDVKSAVDTVITATICNLVYSKGIKNIMLLSSDTDFFGVPFYFKSVQESHMNMCIGYQDKSTLENFKEHFNSIDVQLFSIDSVLYNELRSREDFVEAKYEDSGSHEIDFSVPTSDEKLECFKKLVVNNIYDLSIKSLSDSNVIELLIQQCLIDSDNLYSYLDARDVVMDILSNLTITCEVESDNNSNIMSLIDYKTKPVIESENQENKSDNGSEINPNPRLKVVINIGEDKFN